MALSVANACFCSSAINCWATRLVKFVKNGSGVILGGLQTLVHVLDRFALVGLLHACGVLWRSGKHGGRLLLPCGDFRQPIGQLLRVRLVFFFHAFQIRNPGPHEARGLVQSILELANTLLHALGVCQYLLFFPADFRQEPASQTSAAVLGIQSFCGQQEVVDHLAVFMDVRPMGGMVARHHQKWCAGSRSRPALAANASNYHRNKYRE